MAKRTWGRVWGGLWVVGLAACGSSDARDDGLDVSRESGDDPIGAPSGVENVVSGEAPSAAAGPTSDSAGGSSPSTAAPIDSGGAYPPSSDSAGVPLPPGPTPPG